ncbi:unnamed protein product [Ostreobium quekettii]|uniref:SAWADEE domain-containing protein n=1 Tax=Ostreobium quekettii TaxID=121088 RepID=A0A8S1J1Z0_9CHLO|nr:unnamed protein product [Ostreobium quekettii]
MRQQGLEALSKKDGAWYDVDCTRSKIRDSPNGPRLRVRFRQFDAGEDEYYTLVELDDHFRLRSRPMLDRQCGEVQIGCAVVGLAPLEEHQESKWIDATIIQIKRVDHRPDKCQCSFKVRWQVYDGPGFCQPSRDWLDLDNLCFQSAPTSHLSHSFIVRWKGEIRHRASQTGKQQCLGRLSLPASGKQGAGARKRMYSGAYGLPGSIGAQRRSAPAKFTKLLRQNALPGAPTRRATVQDMAAGHCGYGLLVDQDDGSVSSDSCGAPGWSSSKVVRHIPVPRSGSRDVSTRPLIRKSRYASLQFGARDVGRFQIGNIPAAHGRQALQHAKALGSQAASINARRMAGRRGKQDQAHRARGSRERRVIRKRGKIAKHSVSRGRPAHRASREPKASGPCRDSDHGPRTPSVISDGRIIIEGCVELQGFPYILDACDRNLKAEWYREWGDYA